MLSISGLVNLLRRKVAGEPFPHSFIHEVDPYSAPPEALVRGRDHAPGDDHGDGIAWYFCCHANYHQGAGGEPTQRRKRNVRGGERWHPEAGKRVIAGPDGEAYTRTLSYLVQIRNPAGISPRFRKQRLGWCMLEVGLEQQDGGADQQLLLCKVYRSSRAGPETYTEASVLGSEAPPPPPALSCEWEWDNQVTEYNHNTPVHDPHCSRSRVVFPASKFMPAGIPPRLATVRKGSMAVAVTDVIDLCGSSILSAQRTKEMGNLVRSFGCPVVVMSTMGNTATNILLATWKALSCIVRQASEIPELAITKELHLRTIDELGLDRSIVSGPLDELEHHLQCVATTKELTPTTRDYLCSFGERTSAKLFSEYLNKLGRGTLQKWELRASPTFGRGGSDMTASTVGRDLGSRKIQVWKDQDSIFTCDNNVCAKAIPLPFLTFDEAAEIGFIGAESIQLAIECGISVRVKNSFNPQAHGTLVTKTRATSKSTLTSIVLKSNITILDIQRTCTLDQSAFVEKAISKFKYFEYLGISVNWVATSEKMSFTLVPSKLLSQDLIQPVLHKAVEELQKIADVHRLQGRSVISLIGNPQMSTFILGRALKVLGSSRVAVEKVSQGLSNSKVANVSLVVHDSEAERCVQLLHSAFFEFNGCPVQVLDNSPVTAASSSDKRKADDGHPEAPPGVRQERMNTERWVLQELERSLLSDNDGDPFDGVFRDNNEMAPLAGADGGDNNYLMPVGVDDIFFGGSASMEFFLEQPPRNEPAESWQHRLSLLDNISCSSDPAQELAPPRRLAQPVFLRQAILKQSMPNAGHTRSFRSRFASPSDTDLTLLTTLAVLWLAVCFARIFCQAF